MKDSEDQGPTTEERMNVYKKEAAMLAIEASRNAMDTAKMTAEKITHLITVSCTGFSAPGVDVALMKELGLAQTVSRTHIGFMGCHGAFNGLRVAQAFAAEPKATVLVSSVELCSIHVAYGSDPSQMVANALFADGASSAILSVKKRNSSDWQLAATGSYLFPDSEQAMSWDIGNHGFRMHLSAEIPSLIELHIKDHVTEWLAKFGLTISQIGSWAVHPGGPKILDAVETALELKPDALQMSRQILTQYGNMSSATILYILSGLIRIRAARPCVALGFGPGLHLEIALFL